MVQSPQAHDHGKYDKMGKDGSNIVRPINMRMVPALLVLLGKSILNRIHFFLFLIILKSLWSLLQYISELIFKIYVYIVTLEIRVQDRFLCSKNLDLPYSFC